MSKDKIDNFHYHELLDRTNLIMMNVNDYLVEHPVCDKHKKIKKKLEKSRDLLWEVYQMVSEKY